MPNHQETHTRSPVALVGVGEMGGVFAKALLKLGHPVHPVLRSTGQAGVAAEVPDPALALVTVGENDLAPVLADLPEPWRRRAGLIQNELLPRDWLAAGVVDPTVAVVWFEKKPGRDVKVIIPTPIGGPAAALLVDALATVAIPAVRVDGAGLEWELVRKNLYILTANIAGLVSGGTVMDLWDNHRDLAERVAAEVLDIQEWLVGSPLDRTALVAAMVEAFAADPDHGATGRSAPSRLERALEHAAAASIEVPTLRSIQHDTAGDA
jgi:hypothetical protein